MSKKRAQTEAERARIARELVKYMLDEEEVEPQNPEQLPDAVPKQTTGVYNVGEVEENQHQNMNEGIEQGRRQTCASPDNGIDLLATVLASDPVLAYSDSVSASDLAYWPDSPTSSSSSSYFLYGLKK